MEHRISSYSNLNPTSPAQVLRRKSLNQLTKLAVGAAITAMTLTLTSVHVNAQTQTTPFILAGNSTTTSVSLVVPARTSVRISGVLNPFAGPPIPVVFEVVRPGDNSTSAGLAVVGSNGAQTSFSLGGQANPTTFTSQVGCPSVWRVRIRMGNNQPPPGGLPRTGTVTFRFEMPRAVGLTMIGGPLNIPINQSRTAFLSGESQAGFPNISLIAGTGRFRIKAKWNAQLNGQQNALIPTRLRVELLKPNGSPANAQTGVSQLSNSNQRKVDFGYAVTPADAAMNGLWRLRITNLLSNGPVTISSFEIEHSGVDSFTSTFQARCN